MSSFLNSYDTDINFWEANPMFKNVEAFRALYDKDDTKDKSLSSKIMYAIFFIVDDTSEENKFRNLIYQDRIDLIKNDFLKDPTFDIDMYEDIVAHIKNMIMSPTKRMYSNFKRELEERDLYIQSLSWEEHADQKDKMLTNTEKLYKHLETMAKLLDKENADVKDRGGSQPSSSDGTDM